MYKVQYKDSQDIFMNVDEISCINDFLQLFSDETTIVQLRHRLVDMFVYRVKVGKVSDEIKFNIPYDTWKYLNHYKCDFSDLPLFSEVSKNVYTS